MRSGIRYTIVGAAALVLVPMLTLDVPAILRAQEPTPAPAGAAAPAQGEGEAEAGEPMAAGPEMRALVTLIDQTLPDINSIKPLPEMAIPDPPPHEGAMIDHSLTIQPPDLIQVEFLETLPGRPISGEQLVRPDGTITLGFYGDVHVRGLTLEQAKTKIILHMRMYLTDEALGLIGSPMYKPALEVAAPDAPIPPPPPPPRRREPEEPELRPRSSTTRRTISRPCPRMPIRSTCRGTRNRPSRPRPDPQERLIRMPLLAKGTSS